MANYYVSGYTPPSNVTTSAQVKALQQQLNAQGANIKADGVWGPQTSAAYGSYSQPSSSGGQSGGITTSGSRQSGSLQQSGISGGSPASSGQHVSGYAGNSRQDERGNTYTDYGALLRTDGFYYPEGAKVSPNGMYYDDGDGWKYAKHSTNSNGQSVIGQAGMYGMAPGQKVQGFDDRAIGNGTGSNTTTDVSNVSDEQNTPDTTAGMTDEELERYWKMLAQL